MRNSDACRVFFHTERSRPPSSVRQAGHAAKDCRQREKKNCRNFGISTLLQPSSPPCSGSCPRGRLDCLLYRSEPPAAVFCCKKRKNPPPKKSGPWFFGSQERRHCCNVWAQRRDQASRLERKECGGQGPCVCMPSSHVHVASLDNLYCCRELSCSVLHVVSI